MHGMLVVMVAVTLDTILVVIQVVINGKRLVDVQLQVQAHLVEKILIAIAVIVKAAKTAVTVLIAVTAVIAVIAVVAMDVMAVVAV